MNKYFIFILIILITSFKVFAQISLYKNSDQVYPELYLPNRIVEIKSFEELNNDIKLNSNFVNTYIIDNKLNFKIRSFSTSPETSVLKISNEIYLLDLTDSRDSLFVSLNTSYHGAWDIYYLGEDIGLKCNIQDFQPKFNSKICLQNYSLTDQIKILLTPKKEVSNKHFIGNGFNNTWELQHAKKGIYIILFKVHPYFLFSIGLALLVFFICLFYLLIYYGKKLFNLVYSNFTKIRSINTFKNKS